MSTQAPSGDSPQRQLGQAIWWNGKWTTPSDAKISLFSHSLHYGHGAFEGIRCYKTANGERAIFRLEEHVKRLFDSCKILEIKLPYSEGQLNEAIVETVRRSGLEGGCYIRPLVFLGDGPLGVFPGFNPPVELAIMTWVWGAYLGSEAKQKGARVKVSSYSRGAVNHTMSKAKLIASYSSGILAKMEVKRAGYDEALLLDTEGYVAEGTGENIFMYRDGVLKTTPLTSILPGITRDTVMQIAKEEGIPVVETRFTRDEVYIADEVFFTGTAAEITPIRELDDRMIGQGKPGPITQKISTKFFDIVGGKNPKYAHWLAKV